MSPQPLSSVLHALSQLAEKDGASALDLSRYLKETGHPQPSDEEIANWLGRICTDLQTRPSVMSASAMLALLDFCGERLLTTPFKFKGTSLIEPLWTHLFYWTENRLRDPQIDAALAAALTHSGETMVSTHPRPDELLLRLSAARATKSLAAFLDLPSAPRVDVLFKDPLLPGGGLASAFIVDDMTYFKLFAERGGSLAVPTGAQGVPLWAKILRKFPSDVAALRRLTRPAIERGEMTEEQWDVEVRLTGILKAENAQEARAKLQDYLPKWPQQVDAAGLPVGLRVLERFPQLLPDLVKKGLSPSAASPLGHGIWISIAQCSRAAISQKTMAFLARIPVTLSPDGKGLAAQQQQKETLFPEAALTVFTRAPAAKVFCGFTEELSALWFGEGTPWKKPWVDSQLPYLLGMAHPGELKLLPEIVRGDMLLALLHHSSMRTSGEEYENATRIMNAILEQGFDLSPRSRQVVESCLEQRGMLKAKQEQLQAIENRWQAFQLEKAIAPSMTRPKPRM